MLGGLIQEEDRKTRVTIPWIGDLPLIGNLLSSFKTERVTTEVILTITPRIMQSMPPPSQNNQAFWSGTEFTYATSPLFSNSAKKVPSHGGVGLVSYGQSKNGDTLRATVCWRRWRCPALLLAIQPEETAIQSGKEIKLAIVDARIKSGDQNLFRLEYDPKILQFQRLADAQIVHAESQRQGKPDGAIDFRLNRPAQRAPRSVTVTFVGKVPGVSPVRVELMSPDGDSQSSSSDVGQGVVRVR